MDHFLNQILSVIGTIFMFLWLGAFVAMIYLANIKRKDERSYQKRFTIIFTILLVFILSVFTVSAIYHGRLRNRFMRLVQKPPETMVLTQNEYKVTFDHHNSRISEFITTIADARAVSAHHSFPIHPIKIIFPQQGYFLSLGQDSDVKNEFWLKFDRYPGDEKHDLEVTVKQFFSPQLTEWLKNNFK